MKGLTSENILEIRPACSFTFMFVALFLALPGLIALFFVYGIIASLGLVAFIAGLPLLAGNIRVIRIDSFGISDQWWFRQPRGCAWEDIERAYIETPRFEGARTVIEGKNSFRLHISIMTAEFEEALQILFARGVLKDQIKDAVCRSIRKKLWRQTYLMPLLSSTLLIFLMIYFNGSLLIAAAYFDRLGALNALLKVHADVRGIAGITPLAMAAMQGHVAAARSLCSHGAAVDEGRSDGTTPLMFAATAGNTPMVRFLLERGANAFKRRADGVTALSLAKQKKHEEIITILEQYQSEGR